MHDVNDILGIVAIVCLAATAIITVYIGFTLGRDL